MSLTGSKFEQVPEARLIGREMLEELAHICLFHGRYLGIGLPHLKGASPRRASFAKADGGFPPFRGGRAALSRAICLGSEQNLLVDALGFFAQII